MIKINFEWNHRVEKRLFIFLKKIAFSIFNNKKINVNYSNLLKAFINYSVNFEKEYKSKKNIDIEKHLELAKKQIKEIKEWQNNLNNYVENNKQKSNLKDILKNNAKFRARNMLGNYYKDFLKEIIAGESEYFEWNTMGDERVRPTHEARDGKIYNWDNAEIFPGEINDINQNS